MTFCARCGHQLPSTGGRFCARCGHEAVRGNARYPLYADGSSAVTRPRPRVVPATEQTAVRDQDVTRPRLPIALVDALVDAPVAEDAEAVPAAGWSLTLAATLILMVVLALLGAWLMLH